ncbi:MULTISPECIES: nitroreductase family protein [Flavobacteriaceae]|uniref:nitroreductase family protein n=1 Tax=Flavobacteriaceae TaxID=49546 RepID=UPI0014930519|nr:MULTISPECIES: nitroreductase family protein [Allomuricauda]MDC6366493.1 nitroreductase family protein [Muricauda sp. AC10]
MSKLKQLLKLVDQSLLWIWSKNTILSSFYYFFISGKFRREHHAVLSGRAQYIKEIKEEKAHFYTLVRNTHRIEKGLLMKPRRDVFALDFIGETVSHFLVLSKLDQLSNEPQIQWSYEVLKEYFEVTSNHPVIEEQRKLFSRPSNTFLESASGQESLIPYERNEKKKPNISFEDFLALTHYRRSVRWFLDKPVPHNLIDKALMAARQSPSACNRQPFEYRIIDETELLAEVTNLPMGIKGYQHNIPMMVVVVGNLDAYFNERDRHVVYIDASLANMAFMLALETLGLSSCPINWPDIESLEKRMEKVLKLKKFQRPIMCMAVGYPDPQGKVAYSEKRAIENFRQYN